MKTYDGLGEHLDYAKPYVWRDANGVYHYPETMSTRHLWFTLRMLWNQMVGEEDRLTPYKEHPQFRKNRAYPVEYISRSFIELSKELHTRTNMEPQWIKEFNQIQC